MLGSALQSMGPDWHARYNQEVDSIYLPSETTSICSRYFLARAWRIRCPRYLWAHILSLAITFSIWPGTRPLETKLYFSREEKQRKCFQSHGKSVFFCSPGRALGHPQKQPLIEIISSKSTARATRKLNSFQLHRFNKITKEINGRLDSYA